MDNPITNPHLQLTFVKLSHAMGGLYIWEYLTSLDYEWKIIRGRLPYRWTIWIYSLARLAGLVSVIICFVTMNVRTPINCQFWVLFSVLFLCLASITATLLIVLRTIAIWDRKKAIVALTIIVWGISIGFHLHNIARVRSSWDSAEVACGPAKNYSNAISFIVTILADLVLLLIILVGLQVMRSRSGGASLTRLLWKQGIIWLVIGCSTDIPQLVFTFLHLNDELHSLFEIPSKIIIIIAATRMHRSLVNLTSGASNVVSGSSQLSNITSSRTTGKRSDTTQSTALEIAIHTDIERYPTSSMKDDDLSTIISANEHTPEIIGDPLKYSSDTKHPYSV